MELWKKLPENIWSIINIYRSQMRLIDIYNNKEKILDECELYSDKGRLEIKYFKTL